MLMKWIGTLAAATVLAGLAVPAAMAEGRPVVAMSWANFQEERWKIDEAAIKKRLDELGFDYISADAQSNPSKQLTDVEGLITRGAKVLMIVPMDTEAIVPAAEAAKNAGIPVISYDRLIEVPGTFYISFNNKEVGKIEAEEVFKLVPKGRYAFIKGSGTDSTAHIVFSGQEEFLKPHIDSGDIQVVGDEWNDLWQPEVAQRNMEQILTKNDNKVDAVVSSNDGMAGGVVAALQAQGLEGIPVSGQDADQAALNRIARGWQTVSVWKDVRVMGAKAADIAVALAKDPDPKKVEGATTFDQGPRKVAVDSILLTPVAITKDNLDVVIEAGWTTKDTVCAGVSPDKAPAACK